MHTTSYLTCSAQFKLSINTMIKKLWLFQFITPEKQKRKHIEKSRAKIHRNRIVYTVNNEIVLMLCFSASVNSIQIYTLLCTDVYSVSRRTIHKWKQHKHMQQVREKEQEPKQQHTALQ